MARTLKLVWPGVPPTKLSLEGVDDTVDLYNTVARRLREWATPLQHVRGGDCVLSVIRTADAEAAARGAEVEQRPLPDGLAFGADDAILAGPLAGEFQLRVSLPAGRVTLCAVRRRRRLTPTPLARLPLSLAGGAADAAAVGELL